MSRLRPQRLNGKNVTVRSTRPREYLTEREIEKLIEAARDNRWGHRHATAILLAYRHGLRASELVALRWDDIDFRTGKLHVRRAKGGMTSAPAWRQGAAGAAPAAAGNAGGGADGTCVRVRAPSATVRGWLPAHGCSIRGGCWRSRSWHGPQP
jgi:integrase